MFGLIGGVVFFAGSNVLYKKNCAAKAKAAAKTKSQPKPPTKTISDKKRKSVGGGAPPENDSDKYQEIFSDTIEGAEGQRPCVAFDDICKCVYSPLKGLKVGELNAEEIHIALIRLVAMLFTGECCNCKLPVAREY